MQALFWALSQTYIYNKLTFKWSSVSPGLQGHGLRLHGKHQTESCSNTSQRLRVATQGDSREYECINQRVTWKDKDEEGADPSDDTDDLADVRYKHGYEQCRHYPQDRQHIAAAAFKRHRRNAVTPSPPAQEGVLDHWSDERNGCDFDPLVCLQNLFKLPPIKLSFVKSKLWLR